MRERERKEEQNKNELFCFLSTLFFLQETFGNKKKCFSLYRIRLYANKIKDIKNG